MAAPKTRRVRGCSKAAVDITATPWGDVTLETWSGSGEYTLAYFTPKGIDRLIAALTAVRDARRKGARP